MGFLIEFCSGIPLNTSAARHPYRACSQTRLRLHNFARSHVRPANLWIYASKAPSSSNSMVGLCFGDAHRYVEIHSFYFAKARSSIGADRHLGLTRPMLYPSPWMPPPSAGHQPSKDQSEPPPHGNVPPPLPWWWQRSTLAFGAKSLVLVLEPSSFIVRAHCVFVMPDATTPKNLQCLRRWNFWFRRQERETITPRHWARSTWKLIYFQNGFQKFSKNTKKKQKQKTIYKMTWQTKITRNT